MGNRIPWCGKEEVLGGFLVAFFMRSVWVMIMGDDFECLDGYRRIMFKSALRLASLSTYQFYLCIFQHGWIIT